MRLTGYIFLGVLSFLVFVFALFPANLAWKAVPEQTRRSLPIKVDQVGGTLWDGFAVFQSPGGPLRGQFAVQWEFHPLALLALQAAMTLKVQTAGFDLGGRFHVGVNGYGVSDLSGKLDAALINGWLRSQGVTASGDLKLDNVELVVSGGQVDSASGRITWGGGPVKYSQGRNRQNLELPPILGTVSSDNNGGVLLNFVETRNKQPLADLSVNKDTVGGIKVYQRVLKIAGMGGSGKKDDDILFNLQQPLPMTWENPIPGM